MTSEPKKKDDGDSVLADINSPSASKDKAKGSKGDSALSELNEDQK